MLLISKGGRHLFLRRRTILVSFTFSMKPYDDILPFCMFLVVPTGFIMYSPRGYMGLSFALLAIIFNLIMCFS